VAYHLLSICGVPDFSEKTGSPIVEAFSNLREHIPAIQITAKTGIKLTEDPALKLNVSK